MGELVDKRCRCKQRMQPAANGLWVCDHCDLGGCRVAECPRCAASAKSNPGV